MKVTSMCYQCLTKVASPTKACKAMDDFLNLRLVLDKRMDWIQKVFITRIWLAAEKLPQEPDTLEQLERLLDVVANRVGQPFGAQAVQAAFSVCCQTLNLDWSLTLPAGRKANK